MFSERSSPPALFGVSALLFVASAAVTIGWCGSMSAMGEMPMPGGWSMSMAWMRMPGRSWPGAAASFLGMWVVMMVAMMLPSALPTLARHGKDGRLTIVAGAGYFFVWTVIGAAAFPVGIALAEIEMRSAPLSRAVPLAAGALVLVAGAFQLTAWKARNLACCRDGSAYDSGLPDGFHAAWRHGVRLGLDCGRCCGNLMAILMVIGVMDLRAMALVTAAISAERLAPAGARIACVIGAVVIGVGLFMIARAAGL